MAQAPSPYVPAVTNKPLTVLYDPASTPTRGFDVVVNFVDSAGTADTTLDGETLNLAFGDSNNPALFVATGTVSSDTATISLTAAQAVLCASDTVQRFYLTADVNSRGTVQGNGPVEAIPEGSLTASPAASMQVTLNAAGAVVTIAMRQAVGLPGSGTDVDDDSITNAKLANVATATIKGRATAGTGDPEDLTAAQARALLNVEDGATADQSAAEILTAIKTVDGTGSGLDADTVDGQEASTLLARANHTGTQALSTIADAGTAAALNVPASGDAASGEVVKGDDTRLTDARTPSAHTHTESEITDLGAYPDATGQASGKVAQTDGANGWTFITTPSGGGTDDQNASEVPFTPAGNIGATDVQAAIEELDTEKAASSHTHTASEISDSTAAGRTLLTAADADAQRTALNVEDGADVTDATNVTAALEAVTPAGAVLQGGDQVFIQDVSNSNALRRVDAQDIADLADSGYAPGGTDVAVADGGTGASTASGARTNLGLAIGSDVQAFHANLAALAGLALIADRLPYANGTGTLALATFTAFARTLLDDNNATTARATLGLTIGTHVQAYDAELAALAGLTSAANKLPYFTGSGTASLADLTAFARTLLDDADASAARTTLGLGTAAVVNTGTGDSDVPTGSNLKGTARAYTGQQNAATATLTDAASIAWDLSTQQAAKVTLGGNRTLANPTNMVDGGTYVLRVIQDGTGSRTLAYGANYKWPGGTAPTLSTGAGDVDILSFISDGTNMYGVASLDFS